MSIDEALRALEKKWRDEADRTGAPTKSGAVLVTNEDRGYSNALYSAADELAALLRKLQQGAEYVVVGYTLPLSDGSLSESAATFDTDHQFKRKVAVPLYAHVSSQDQEGGNG